MSCSVGRNFSLLLMQRFVSPANRDSISLDFSDSVCLWFWWPNQKTLEEKFKKCLCSFTCFLHWDRWWPSSHRGMSCCYSTLLSLSIGDGHGEGNPEVLGAGCCKGKWHQAASVPLGFLVHKIHHNKGIKIPQTKSLNQVPTQETVGFTWWSCGALSKGMKITLPDALV